MILVLSLWLFGSAHSRLTPPLLLLVLLLSLLLLPTLA
jgi:hypothetical protein